eukprot:g19075.t1
MEGDARCAHCSPRRRPHGGRRCCRGDQLGGRMDEGRASGVQGRRRVAGGATFDRSSTQGLDERRRKDLTCTWRGERGGKRCWGNSQVQKRKGMFKRKALGHALQIHLKKKGGRQDIEYEDAPKSHHSLMTQVALKDRAGYPLVRKKGSVDPAQWRTLEGKEIIVDFSRHAWLPDDWGQGVKATNPRKDKKTTTGGTYTVMVSPEGKVFYHRKDAEKFYGQEPQKKSLVPPLLRRRNSRFASTVSTTRPRELGEEFSLELGFNGQVRSAQLQAKEAIQVARASIKEHVKRTDWTFGRDDVDLWTTDSDKLLFNILKPHERKCIPPKNKFHFAIISARRATEVEGIRRSPRTLLSVAVEAAFLRTPVWYVDEESLKAYRKLGLNAVAGGKLTPARNKALQDAARAGKICVQASDDISAWEYRHGKRAAERTDEAMNAAYDAAKRLILSPVAAAQFIVAKMRASDEKPKLGGVYPLGSCARSFAGDEVQLKNFILGEPWCARVRWTGCVLKSLIKNIPSFLGPKPLIFSETIPRPKHTPPLTCGPADPEDFFVVEPDSKVRFDEEIALKEDYDFTASHIKEYGSVMRCQRMTLRVKHYSNSGGACSNRDKKGKEDHGGDQNNTVAPSHRPALGR